MILQVLPVTAFAENVYFVGDEKSKEAAVIDPGGESQRILAVIKELGVTVKYILNTHGHMDHVGAVKAVKDATGALFGIHAQDVAVAQRPPARQIASLIPDFAPAPAPDLDLKEGDEFALGDLVLRIIETPGHTMGCVCIHTDGVLFSGDTLFEGSIGRTDFPGSSHEMLVSSVRTKLWTLDDETLVLPGHGPDTTIGREKKYNPFVGLRAQL